MLLLASEATRTRTPEDDTDISARGNHVSTRRRAAAIHILGNLTILTQALNSTVSNSAWKVKKPERLVSSFLPINQQLHAFATRDESSIEVRGRGLFDMALKLWPGPTAA
ncbi:MULTISPECIES: HNH endonuclease family protein [Sorangium]|uniref:HNH endonuclease family protein n=1 Tax=Sorangium TaxID=39643 RepID=UPI003D9C0D6F